MFANLPHWLDDIVIRCRWYRSSIAWRCPWFCHHYCIWTWGWCSGEALSWHGVMSHKYSPKDYIISAGALAFKEMHAYIAPKRMTNLCMKIRKSMPMKRQRNEWCISKSRAPRFFAYSIHIACMILRTGRLLCIIYVYTEICVNVTPSWHAQNTAMITHQAELGVFYGSFTNVW